MNVLHPHPCSPLPQLREIVLDGIYEILHLPLPKGQENPFARDNSKDSEAVDMNFTFDLPSRTRYTLEHCYVFGFSDISCVYPSHVASVTEPHLPSNLRHNVLNNYTAALLMSLIKAGVIEVLIELGNDVFGEEMTKVHPTDSYCG